MKECHKDINLSSSIASKLNSDIGHQTDLSRKRKCFLCLLLLCALVPWDMELDAKIYLGVDSQGDFGNLAQ